MHMEVCAGGSQVHVKKAKVRLTINKEEKTLCDKENKRRRRKIEKEKTVKHKKI